MAIRGWAARQRVTPDRRWQGYPVASAVALDIGGIIPVGLFGALAVQVRHHVHFTVGFLGLAVALFFVSGGVVAVVFGPEVDRFGWRRSATVAACLSALCLLGLAHANAGWQMLIALALGGAGQAIIVPAANVMLSHQVAPDRLGGTIGVTLAAVPAALLLSGVAVPAVALTVGWRWAFLGAAAFPIGGLLLAPHAGPSQARTQSGPRSESRAAQRRLARVGVGVFLASLLPGALTGFCVITLVASGTATSTAGVLFAIGNAIGVVVRVRGGRLAERRGSDCYRPVGALMVAGAVGAGLLAVSGREISVLGAMIALGIGCSWPGLTFFLVVRAESGHPGSSGAVVQMGGMLGSASGPALIGLIERNGGRGLGWTVIAGAAAVGGGIVASARRRLPPTTPAATTTPAVTRDQQKRSSP